jgi:hypothetical protein
MPDDDVHVLFKVLYEEECGLPSGLKMWLRAVALCLNAVDETFTLRELALVPFM